MNANTNQRARAARIRRFGGGVAATALACFALTGCETNHAVPAHPTWADVEPILRAECLHCHGGGAPLTASTKDAVYRFDFYDLKPDVCGEAASAIDLPTLAAGWSTLIGNAITSANPSIRPRMPPAPASSLATWEWQTILRWTTDPQKGPAPTGNRPPTIRRTDGVNTVNARLSLSVVVEDPDGESAAGVLSVGGLKVKLDRPGGFDLEFDTSSWPAGEITVQGIVCDGWTNATYGLGSVVVRHQ